MKSLSRVRLLATPWTAAHQAPPSMGFSRQEHWSGVHCLLQYLPISRGLSYLSLTDTLSFVLFLLYIVLVLLPSKKYENTNLWFLSLNAWGSKVFCHSLCCVIFVVLRSEGSPVLDLAGGQAPMDLCCNLTFKHESDKYFLLLLSEAKVPSTRQGWS